MFFEQLWKLCSLQEITSKPKEAKRWGLVWGIIWDITLQLWTTDELSQKPQHGSIPITFLSSSGFSWSTKVASSDTSQCQCFLPLSVGPKKTNQSLWCRPNRFYFTLSSGLQIQISPCCGWTRCQRGASVEASTITSTSSGTGSTRCSHPQPPFSSSSFSEVDKTFIKLLSFLTQFPSLLLMWCRSELETFLLRC